MPPHYTLNDIKFGIDQSTWQKAVALYEQGKVKNFKNATFTFTANVQGTHLYRVFVSQKKYEDGDCTCYLGQNDTLCKHMIALVIYGVKRGQALTQEEKTQSNQIVFSNQIKDLSDEELKLFKAEISGAMRYIKSYDGPSRTWLAYQGSLSEGCNRLAEIFSRMPVSLKTADLIIKTLLRLDKKLSYGGVDDSDGTVGGFIEEGVDLLLEFVHKKSEIETLFKQLENRETCFGWEEPLLKLLEKSSKICL